MDDHQGMPPVLVYSSWRPPAVTIRRQVLFSVIGILLGALAGMALLFVTVAATGGGHGTYGAAKLFFPFTMALTGVTEEINTPGIVIALAQYPLYGLLIGWLTARNRRVTGWKIFAAVHLCALALAIGFSDSSFSP